MRKLHKTCIALLMAAALTLSPTLSQVSHAADLQEQSDELKKKQQEVEKKQKDAEKEE